MKSAILLLALALGAATVTGEAQAASLADISFLKGNWTSNRSGFVIEESWADAQAGVVIGMSRGVQSGSVRFLRVAVVEQAGDAVVMRFKQYNADFSSWETDGPSVMRLVKAERDKLTFEATDPASTSSGSFIERGKMVRST